MGSAMRARQIQHSAPSLARTPGKTSVQSRMVGNAWASQPILEGMQ